MHNVSNISLVVRREALSITLSVEGCIDLKNIVHFYRLNKPGHGRGIWLEVTEFSTRGGRNCSSISKIEILDRAIFFQSDVSPIPRRLTSIIDRTTRIVQKIMVVAVKHL